MTVLLTLALLLLAAHGYTRSLVRREALRHLMRPADEWDAEDVDHWLDLIETFPLPDPTRKPN